MGSEDGRHDQDAINFKQLLDHPTQELWLTELKLVLSGESWGRRSAMEHLGDFGEYCEGIISRSSDSEQSRAAIIPAIDQLLAQYAPEQETTNNQLCWDISSLIGHFTPPTGFDWSAKMLSSLGMPDIKTHEGKTGLGNVHLQSLHALGRYFLRLPKEGEEVERDEEGYTKKIFTPQTPDMLTAYVDILDNYAKSPNAYYAGYAKRILKELSDAKKVLGGSVN